MDFYSLLCDVSSSMVVIHFRRPYCVVLSMLQDQPLELYFKYFISDTFILFIIICIIGIGSVVALHGLEYHGSAWIFFGCFFDACR